MTPVDRLLRKLWRSVPVTHQEWRKFAHPKKNKPQGYFETVVDRMEIREIARSDIAGVIVAFRVDFADQATGDLHVEDWLAFLAATETRIRADHPEAVNDLASFANAVVKALGKEAQRYG